MQVDLSLLEKTIMTIFTEMRQRGIDNIPLDKDFYWNVPSSFIYNIYNEPEQLDIGQLEDDYKTLKYAHETNKLIGYHLKNISAITRFLSEKYPV